MAEMVYLVSWTAAETRFDHILKLPDMLLNPGSWAAV